MWLARGELIPEETALHCKDDQQLSVTDRNESDQRSLGQQPLAWLSDWTIRVNHIVQIVVNLLIDTVLYNHSTTSKISLHVQVHM